MGVPGFFLWLWKKYKSQNFVFSKSSIPEIDIEKIDNIDYFMLDMNCMIHPICFETLKTIEGKTNIDKIRLENKMIRNVIQYLEKTINIVKPKKCIYIAIDGVAPVAKMKQQRLRRYKHITDTEMTNNIRRKHNKPIPYYWSNSAITPGTEFMRNLTHQLTEWCKQYSNMNKIEIIFSTSSIPGEGEHKLLQYMKTHTEKYNYVIYGLDADLIFLMLTTQKNDIYLMREANKMDDKSDGFNFVSIDRMKVCIVDSMKEIIKKDEILSTLEINIDPNNVIDDFILICYMMGNDFLPHMPSLDIYNRALDILIKEYVTIISENAPQMTYIIDRKNEHMINSDIFYRLIIALASMEERTIVEAYGKNKKSSYCQSSDPFDIEMSRIENLMFKIDDPIRLGDGNIMEWRERMYTHYYHTTPDEIDKFTNKMVENYMIGIKWVTLYYFDKCPSWDWYYPYDHAPLLYDIARNKMFEFSSIRFIENNPLSPFEQLLTVLPKASSYLVPECLRKIMTNINGSASHLYPIKFELDMIGKKKHWMCTPILPNLEINLIRKIYLKYSKLLSSDLRMLNTPLKSPLIFK